MARSSNRDQDEVVFTKTGDERSKVLKEDLKLPPYVRIMRLVVEKQCCRKDFGVWSQGTCSLVKCDRPDDYWRFTTAGHVLFCRFHRKFADSVELLSASGTSIVTLTRGASDTAPGWYAVLTKFIKTSRRSDDDSSYRAHDVGLVTVKRSMVPRELTKYDGFSVCSSVPTEQKGVQICGYPAEVRGTPTELQYRHYGTITLLDCYHGIDTSSRLWEHWGDTSPGQSGGPLFIGDVQFGIHIGPGTKLPDSEVKDRNLAVVLDDKLCEDMFEGAILTQAGKGVSSILTGVVAKCFHKVKAALPRYVVISFFFNFYCTLLWGKILGANR